MNLKGAVIGAGVSGLTQAIFLQKNGIDTTIFESSNVACSSLKVFENGKKVYDFGLNDFVGSNKDSIEFKLWKTAGAFKDDDKFNFQENSIYEIEDEYFILNHNFDDFKKSLLDISIEDNKLLNKFFDDLQLFMLSDFKNLKFDDYKKLIDSLKCNILLYFKYGTITVEKFANKFANIKLQNIFKSIIPEDFPMYFLVEKLLNIFAKNNGTPAIGTKQFVNNLVNTFLSLGGKIEYNSKVEKISYELKKVTGVVVNNQLHKFDYVVSTIDIFTLLSKLLDGKFKHKQAFSLLKKREIYFSEIDYYFFMKNKIDLPNLKNIYLGERGVNSAPEFCNFEADFQNAILNEDTKNSCLKFTLRTYYDFWVDLRQKGIKEDYLETKYMYEDDLSNALNEKIKNFKSSIDYYIVETPATLIKNNPCFRAAKKGFTPSSKLLFFKIKEKVAPLQNLYINGVWSVTEPNLGKLIVNSDTITKKILKQIQNEQKKKK